MVCLGFKPGSQVCAGPSWWPAGNSISWETTDGISWSCREGLRQSADAALGVIDAISDLNKHLPT